MYTARKILEFTVWCKEKSSNSNCHRLFVNKCACRNSDLKCKKKTACTPNRFDNCTHKIKSHSNSARLYLKNMYGSIKSGSRRSCVHKFNWQCAFNSYIEQTCRWKVLLHNNWKAVCLLKRGHKIFQSCMQSWKVGKQACCKWCHAFQLLCWYYMVVLNVSCQHGKKKKHVPILGTFFFSARLVKLHVSMYKAQSWLSLQEVGKGY